MAYHPNQTTSMLNVQNYIPMQTDQSQPMQFVQQNYQYANNFPNPNQTITHMPAQDTFTPPNMASYQPQTSYQLHQFPSPPHNPEWQLANNKKRGRRNSSDVLVNQDKPTTPSTYWLDPENRFSPLYNDTALDQGTSKTDTKPPPIFVSGVKTTEPLIQFLDSIAKDEYSLKALTNNEIKIMSKTPEKYSLITKGLIEKKTEFHTYQMKKERSFRVFLRNLHPSTSTNGIKDELQMLGHVAINVWNVKQASTKKELPLFVVDLKPSDNNKEIYNVDKLMHSVVKFEPPYAKRTITQCSRCQKHGHTKNFCNRSPRCVKCTGQHSTSQCQYKEKYQGVTCVNCNGNHPANYKGCPVYKELHQRTFPPLRQKTLPTTKFYQPGLAYAQVAAGNTQQPNSTMPLQHNTTPINNPTDFTELKHMLKQLMEQMGTMLNLLTTLISRTTTGSSP